MRAALVVVVVFAAAACHHGTRTPLGSHIPSNGDPEARARYKEAYAKFLEDSRAGGAELKQIVEDFPNDPIVPWAELYAGIASVKARQYPDADKQLAKVLETDVDAGLTAKATLFLGITKNYEGDTAAARKLLPRADRAIEGDDERTEYLAAVAYSTAAGDNPLAALPVFDMLWPRVTPTEKASILARVEGVVAGANPDALRHTYDELTDRKGPSIAIVGSRLVLVMEAAGDTAGAAKRREDIAPVRAAVGLPKTIVEAEVGTAKSGAGDPNLLGAVVPLGSKRENRIAEAAVAGLGLAAGAPDGKGVAAIETRAAGDKTEAAEAVDKLAHANVIAIVGPIEGSAVDAAGGRAEGLGVPLISLATAAEQRTQGRFVFHIRHSAEARARALAQRALAKGITKFAVFAPENGYGKAVTAAFTEAVQKGGGTIVKTVTYAKDTKSFAAKAKDLGDSWQAVFVPDSAENLALAAPAIAAAGNIPKAMPFPKKVLGGRAVVLLSTAEDLTNDFLTAAGRHAEGAFLAPGFYPDDADPATKSFIDRFVVAYGHVPGAGEAYAFDAAQLVASASAGGRTALASALASSQLVGVTGTIKFDSDHHRIDPGVIYTVLQETTGFAIRVAK